MGVGLHLAPMMAGVGLHLAPMMAGGFGVTFSTNDGWRCGVTFSTNDGWWVWGYI